MSESDSPVVSSVSENMADIYQDVKDFLMVYRIGTYEFMNDALWECNENFKTYWGQKVANVLRAIHNLLYNYNFDEENTNEERSKLDTKNWIISKRQEDYTDDTRI